ncbi:rhomboid family intramembrane serine protease [Botrimarina hoheduenensis]|uniref:Rhomboid family protein n=1 Tax=Botrimarina hoheduenensis TaxID=2528000 RepID=A0A5C5VXX6_9BACT|nr:rhomboid family intramembrane serine protease [Botrimarina hoheduenensis]TWT43294.1 Rhomboid family protein [Botrimarina hoheduenensis]
MLLPLYDRNPHHRFPVVTVLLILLNVFFFWRSVDGGVQNYVGTIFEHGFIPARLTNIDSGQPVLVQQQLPEGGAFRASLSTDSNAVYATLVSMMFLHGGLLHLVSNVWMLWVFGDNVEDRLGRLVYPFFYLLGGVVAGLTQWAASPDSTTPVIGASGAIAAVLGAYVVTFPRAKVKTLIFVGLPLIFDLPSYLVLGAWFVLQTIGGIQGIGAPVEMGVNVAYWTHIGGFVAGVILMPLLTIGVAPPGAEDWRTESRKAFEF